MVCRASAGVCDVEEKCDGTNPSCPTDAFAAASVVCRPATSTGCDVEEKCAGSATCPADAFAAPGFVCRAQMGDCDVEETCSGTNDQCPADGVAAKSSAGMPTCAPFACDGTNKTCPIDCLGDNGLCEMGKTCTMTQCQ